MKAFFLPVILVASLSACASAVETRVSSSGETGLAPATYVWATTASAPTVELIEARRLVVQKLSDRGFTLNDAGTVHVEVTLASRPAPLAIIAGEKDVLAPAKRNKLFQRCADNEYRLGIAITRIADGASLYTGNASEHHCKQPLVAVLPALVAAAIADLGQPRGRYAVRRQDRVLPEASQ